jgi:hypothetical protein
VGIAVETALGATETSEGATVGTTGTADGATEGAIDGTVDKTSEGSTVGTIVAAVGDVLAETGTSEGTSDGAMVGFPLVDNDGTKALGNTVGNRTGVALGITEEQMGRIQLQEQVQTGSDIP